MAIDKMVSIVIVNYNGKTHLEKCLQSIMKINYAPYEVIVVDNNSTDGSVELLQTEYPKVKIIKLDGNYGFAEPNNIGAKNAKGEYLLFLNNDTVVTPDFITELVNVMNQDPKIAICQSLLLKPNGEVDSSGDFMDFRGSAYSSKIIPKQVKPILSAKGATLLIKRNIFFELDGFDEKFFITFEDVDLGWRSWILGYKVVIAPKSLVYHLLHKTIEKTPVDVKFHGIKNLLILKLTNFEVSKSIESILFLLPSLILYRIFGVSINNNDHASNSKYSIWTIMKAVFWILRNFRYVLKKQRQVNSSRKQPSTDLVKLGLIT